MSTIIGILNAVLFCLLVLLFAAHPAGAADNVPDAQESSVRGVNPADNISKYELLPKYTRISDENDISVYTLTLKYDKAINKVYGVNIELPFSRFDSPLGETNGNGDLNIRGRYQMNSGRWTGIIGMEFVVPVASDDLLGSGKWQTNPVMSAVYAFSLQSFGVVVAKHFFSIAGDEDRTDIVQGQYRMLFAHTTKSGWWVLLDPQLYVDYDKSSRAEFGTEIEIGKMVGKTTGVWLRGGGHVAGSWDRQEYNISSGVRFITF
ncbi:MAG: hypothetical protein JZU72_00065 [Chlorobium phaeobacteroides]|jgi:hypothetical protein|nr:hypothetical protein [Chlorobium phaeobacteroides]